MYCPTLSRHLSKADFESSESESEVILIFIVICFNIFCCAERIKVPNFHLTMPARDRLVLAAKKYH